MKPLRLAGALSAVAVSVYLLYVSEAPSLLAVPQSAELAVWVASFVSAASALAYALLNSRGLEVQSSGTRWVGWVPFGAGLAVYTLGTFSPAPAVIHWVSLWLVIQAIGVLLLGIRNSAFALPGTSLLLVIAPAAASGSVLWAGILLLCASASAVILFCDIFPLSLRPAFLAPFALEFIALGVPGSQLPWIVTAASALGVLSAALAVIHRGDSDPRCELDRSPLNEGRHGCVKCGRVLNAEGAPHAGSEAAVLATLLVVSFVIWSLTIPMVAVTPQDVNISSVRLTQVSMSPLISPPPGFLQNSSSPSTSLQTQYREALVVVKEFFPVQRPENFSYTVYIEVSSSHDFLVKHWQYLGGYNRTTEVLVAGGAHPVTVYSTLLRANGTSIVAVSYEFQAVVTMGGDYRTVNIGVSALAFPSFNMTSPKYEAIKAQMLSAFVRPQAALADAAAWTQNVEQTQSTIDTLGPYASMGGGAVLVFGAMGAVLKADRRDQRLLDNVNGLGTDDQRALAASVRLRTRRRPRTGEELLEECVGSAVDEDAAYHFYSRLKELEAMGYMRQTPRFSGGRPRFLWRSESV